MGASPPPATASGADHFFDARIDDLNRAAVRLPVGVLPGEPELQSSFFPSCW